MLYDDVLFLFFLTSVLPEAAVQSAEVLNDGPKSWKTLSPHVLF